MPASAPSPRSSESTDTHPARPRILVVDDEENLRHLLRVILEREGCEVLEAVDGEAALEALDDAPDVQAVLCDVRMPRLDGMGFLDRVRERGLSVVMMSAYGSTDTAVSALNHGAFDYISKPFRADEIRSCVRRILRRRAGLGEADSGPVGPTPMPERRARSRPQDGGEQLVARAPATRQLVERMERIADTDVPVLIRGESGVGKELVARRLHALSDRAGRPVQVLRCAGLSEDALRGGADPFSQAGGGSLVLDEPAELALDLQVLLRGQLDRRRQPRPRLISLSSTDLEAACAEGRFRQDLLDRLAGARLSVPPLRRRGQDLPELARRLMRRAAERLKRPVEEISEEALHALAEQSWPGNVRQLDNVLQQAVLVAQGSSIGVEELPLSVRRRPRPGGGGVVELGPDDGQADLSIKRHSARLERHLIELALARTEGNRSQAARLLDISYKALVYKIRDYELED